MILFSFLSLFIAAFVYDVRRKEIPSYLPATALGARALYLIFAEDIIHVAYYLLCGAILFGYFYLFARFGNMGGADCVYIGLVGISIGYFACYVVFIAAAFSIPHIIVAIRHEDKFYPFLPYMATAFALTLILMYKAQTSIPLFF